MDARSIVGRPRIRILCRMNGSRADVVVVGGGIVGTAAAAFLADEGLRVVLVEREGLASGASGANSGVVQHPFDPVLASLYRDTVRLYRDRSAVGAGFDLADEPVGMLFVTTDEAAARREAETIRASSPELRTEVIGGPPLRDLEPAVADGLWACRVDIGYPVAPAASTYDYATLAQAGGAVVRLGRAAALELDGDAVVGVRIDGEPLAAKAVLAAAGPWTPELIDPTGRWAPIERRWGVVVEVELAAPPRHVLEEAGIDAAIGVPGGPSGAIGRADEPRAPEVEFSLVPPPGRVPPPSPVPETGAMAPGGAVPQPRASSVGSTFLEREPDPSAWIESLLLRASRYVPGVLDAPIRGVRACARPQSLDGRPLVGSVPGRPGLFVCAGHGAWGISTGPASARLVVDLILGRNPAIPPELDPLRFGAPRN